MEVVVALTLCLEYRRNQRAMSQRVSLSRPLGFLLVCDILVMGNCFTYILQTCCDVMFCSAVQEDEPKSASNGDPEDCSTIFC